jgi:hypothetical protein
VSRAEKPWKQRTPGIAVVPLDRESQEDEVFPKDLVYREGHEYHEQ